ncbi:hypothetical protein AGMMS49525_11490 [Bacteroidia bacterium]|nr:hypothetical protein AGMMS49525_11490 [Bacteroidia bacterium]
MSFGEIMNIYQDGDILISPDFQRLYRWSDYQKTRFIESILLGIPIPPIFVAEDENGKWELVDGLQCLSTIFSFFGILKKNETELDTEKNNWILTEGDIINSLDGKSKEDLPLKFQIAIKRSVCRVEILHWDNENNNLKYELFNRLNTGGSTATEQEIRNCIFRGKTSAFNDFLKKLSTNEILYKLVLPSKKQKEELYLEELVLRFIALYCATEETEITENISRYMTSFMRKCVDDDNFQYDELENIFTKSLTLLNNLNDEKIFRAEVGPFSNNMYDVIILGVAFYLDYYENENIEVLRNKINTLKQGKDLLATSSIKVNAKQRNIKRIELAKSFFQAE